MGSTFVPPTHCSKLLSYPMHSINIVSFIAGYIYGGPFTVREGGLLIEPRTVSGGPYSATNGPGGQIVLPQIVRRGPPNNVIGLGLDKIFFYFLPIIPFFNSQRLHLLFFLPYILFPIMLIYLAKLKIQTNIAAT